MNCFPCCPPKKTNSMRETGSPPPEPDNAAPAKAPAETKKPNTNEAAPAADPANMNAKAFTFRELATATKNFRQDCLLDEDGMGKVYKGIIPATGQVVAVKQLDRHGVQLTSKEFLAEVAALSLLQHEHLVSLIGYCADGDQRLLVYDYFNGRTLEDRISGEKQDEGPLNWYERMKIASCASQGLQYLHETANPPVIYRDLKLSNILIDTNLDAKLCDFGMAKLTGGDKNNGPPRLMGTYGHCAPEYVRTGQLTLKSDVYSFGVILLELITGRRAVDTTRPNDEQNLAQPIFRDPKKYPDMADPALNKQFPEKDLNQVVAIAAMCLQEEPEARPLISDAVTALGFLSSGPGGGVPAPVVSRKSSASAGGSRRGSGSESESGSQDGSDSKGEVAGNKSSKKHGSAKHKENENLPPLAASKHSRKSSCRSRSSESVDGSSVCSEKDLSKKSSKKEKKKSRKHSLKELGKKISRKKSSSRSSVASSSETGSGCSSRRSSSAASSSEDEGGERSSMRLSGGNRSFCLNSSESGNNSTCSRAENQSRNSRASSMGSDGGRGHSFGSDEGSEHSQ
ncbi:hypothetical protein RJT34_23291 [Clitoria ternatea]|uniref:Protein kinase domain-containing protein n=1 Tax=Clitoria ternatea TaxID=43366 RepID=A0AAN9FRT5_CLITE